MNNLRINFIYALIVSFLFGCESSEEPLIPTVVILQIQNLADGGVEIVADFQNFEEEDELGFRIVGEQFFDLHIITNPKIGENTFSIKTGLYQDKKYYATAYIKKSDEEVLLSRQKEFYALSGSFIPKVNKISPDIGYIGDLVEINFSEKLGGAKKEDFNIKFHIQDAHIIDIIDDQKIICRVPKFISRHLYYRYTWAKMSITYLGKVVPTNYEFNLKAPKITSISPKLIDWGEEIIIKGDFYKEGYPADLFTININNVPVTEITKITATEARCKVSIHRIVNNPEILLSSNNRGVLETDTFSYYPPEIISFQQGAIGDEIEIIGKYFWPASYVNEVYFDNYKAEITYGDSTKLIVKIPNGSYINNKAILKIKISDEIFSEGKEFNIQ